MMRLLSRRTPWVAALLVLLATAVGATNFTLPLGVPSNVYLSSVSANGIGIGSDANPCTLALPCLTWDRGKATVPDGGTIWLNDDGSNTVYRSATSTVLDGNITVRGVVTTAVLAGVGTTQSLTLQPTAGQTITVRDLTLDASQNSGGTAAACVNATAQSTTYSVTFLNVTLKNWTSYCFPAVASLKANITLSCVTMSSTSTVDGGVYLTGFIAGGFRLDDTGCSGSNRSVVTLTMGSTSQAAIYANATAGTPTCVIYNTNFTITIASGSSRQIYGGVCSNMANARVDGDVNSSGIKSTLTVTMTGGTTSCWCLGVRTFNTLGQELSVAGGTVKNYTISIDSYGGIGAFLGGESGTSDSATYQTGMSMSGVSVTGGSNFYGHAGHCLMNAWTTSSGIINSSATNCGLGNVNKKTISAVDHDITITNANSSDFLWKGSTNPEGYNLAASNGVGWNGTLAYFEQDDVSLTYTTGGNLHDSTFTIAGATSAVRFQVDTGSDAAFARNTQNRTSGTENGNPYRYQGSLYSSCALWTASGHETAPVCNVPRRRPRPRNDNVARRRFRRRRGTPERIAA